MNVKELIAIASIRSGKTRKQMAAEMGHPDDTRLSKLGAGKLRLEPGETVYLAQHAERNAMELLAELDAERYPQFASFWQAALQGRKVYFSTIRLGSYASLHRRFTRIVELIGRSIRPQQMPHSNRLRILDTDSV